MPDKCHPSHVTEYRDSSHYEERCVNCGQTDTPSGWGKLAKPCPAVTEPEPDPVGRLETGNVIDRDDWPGVFIRGDNALMLYAPALERTLAGEAMFMDAAILQGLVDLMKGCNAFDKDATVQYVIKQEGKPDE